MLIVTYSDASFRNNRGTWAGCVTLDNTLVVEYEEKIEKCHSVDFAELYGVYRIIEEVPKIWSQKVALKVFTDSMSVIRWLVNLKEPRHKTTRLLYNKVVNIIKNQNIFTEVEILHISRHSTNYFFKNCHSRAITINI